MNPNPRQIADIPKKLFPAPTGNRGSPLSTLQEAPESSEPANISEFLHMDPEEACLHKAVVMVQRDVSSNRKTKHKGTKSQRNQGIILSLPFQEVRSLGVFVSCGSFSCIRGERLQAAAGTRSQESHHLWSFRMKDDGVPYGS